MNETNAIRLHYCVINYDVLQNCCYYYHYVIRIVFLQFWICDMMICQKRNTTTLLHSIVNANKSWMTGTIYMQIAQCNQRTIHYMY